jgi:hypothetical protein
MAKMEFKTVIELLKALLIPMAIAVREGTSFGKHWEPGGSELPVTPQQPLLTHRSHPHSIHVFVI